MFNFRVRNPTQDCAGRTAIGILGGRPPIGSAYRLKLGSSGRDDGCSRAAFVIKNQGRDGGDIFIGYPKGRSGQPDGESDLLLIKRHKPRGVGLRGGREGGGGNVLVDSAVRERASELANTTRAQLRLVGVERVL